MSQPFFGMQPFSSEMLPVQTTNILEFDAFEQIPDAFLWIEFWGISRQLLQKNPFGSAFLEVLFDRLATMNGGSIPDHEQLARDLAREQLQKANDIGTFVRMVLALHDDLSFCGDGAHSRKMIPRQLDLQGGGLAHRRVGPHEHGQQIKSRLIYKDYGALFFRRLFFRAGQRSSFQAAMAASSRWLAFSMGFCRLCFNARRRRLQWAG